MRVLIPYGRGGSNLCTFLSVQRAWGFTHKNRVFKGVINP
nr:MAG TPA: hypothetical protein [Caudoviricetes sp.]